MSPKNSFLFVNLRPPFHHQDALEIGRQEWDILLLLDIYSLCLLLGGLFFRIVKKKKEMRQSGQEFHFNWFNCCCIVCGGIQACFYARDDRIPIENPSWISINFSLGGLLAIQRHSFGHKHHYEECTQQLVCQFEMEKIHFLRNLRIWLLVKKT